MTNEDRILELLMGMQKDIVGLKQDMGDLKQDVSGLKRGLAEVAKNQSTMQDDLSFLVRKTMENNDDIRKLKVAK